jgi:16S rRNA (cytosine967-C5)-methyltransferase
MKVTPARRIAFDVLRRVETGGALASDLLHARLEELDARAKSGKARADAALATELTLGVLRWQRLLDLLIAWQTHQPAENLDAEVRIALRLGLYQLRFLSRIPAAAAVNESVELVKAARKSSAAALVNAVLRRAPRGDVATLLPHNLSKAERLGILYSHPTWLVARWLERFGEAHTVALLAANNRAPETAVAVHRNERREEIIREWRAADVTVESGRWLETALRVRGLNVAATPAFRRGDVSIQDEASQMVAHLLEVQPGDSVLDLCAAPGGKTALLAKSAGPLGRVVAADVYPHRLRAMRETLQRVGARGVLLVALDGERGLPFQDKFQRILVDAPCSGTGTLARNPEIRWRLQPEDLKDLPRRQAALLTNALHALAPGGRLVYSTCSLEPEENEQVVAAALRGRSGVRRVQAKVEIQRQDITQRTQRGAEGAEKNVPIDEDGYFRTLPHVHASDGFFAAVIAKD